MLPIKSFLEKSYSADYPSATLPVAQIKAADRYLDTLPHTLDLMLHFTAISAAVHTSHHGTLSALVHTLTHSSLSLSLCSLCGLFSSSQTTLPPHAVCVSVCVCVCVELCSLQAAQQSEEEGSNSGVESLEWSHNSSITDSLVRCN